MVRSQGRHPSLASIYQAPAEHQQRHWYQLLAPMLDRIERLPVPRREALRTAPGLSVGLGRTVS
jgi:hypothetical protein